jgi:prophage regulatory protein
MPHSSQPPVRRIIAAPQVSHLTGLSRSSVWRALRVPGTRPGGKFPSPVRLSPGRIGWFLDEVEAWLNSRPRTHPTMVEA